MSGALRTLALVESNYGTFRGWVRSCLADLEFVAGRLDAFVAPDPLAVHRVVFVCLGNINRSAFAAAVAKAEGLATCSIGLSTTTGAPAFTTAISTARDMRVNLDDHAATNLADYVRQPGDLLLVMEVRHARQLIGQGVPAQSIALLGYWASPRRIHLHDPHVLSLPYFRTCFTLIQSAVANLAREFRAAQSPCVQR